MSIAKVREVRQAEIDKEKAVVKAGEERETTIIVAEGQLEAERKNAEGIKVKGEAEAEAKKLMELAPIRAQIELAQEIGENEGYQQYLVAIEAIAAQLQVGVAQAKALEAADIKVIANGGSASEGMNGAAGILSSKTGQNLNGMLETLAQSDQGKKLVDMITGFASSGGLAKAISNTDDKGGNDA